MAERTLGRRLRDRGLLVRALACQLRLRAELSVRPFRTVLRRVERTRVASVSPDPVEGRRRIRAVERTSRFVPGARCLVQAMACKLLLARAGVASDLRIGVARDEDRELEAHAWVEIDGRVVHGGRESARYTPFPELPSEEP